ncbi:MAG TPA: hypothetical protein DDY54_04435, partial [Deltaproteobacteria bacterium]|nr:hypothetical protein [Deltaproteobacteria bacterium]
VCRKLCSGEGQRVEKIFTFVRGDNDVALSTYLSQGFQVIGTAKKQAKVQGNYIDENLIEKFL